MLPLDRRAFKQDRYALYFRSDALQSGIRGTNGSVLDRGDVRCVDSLHADDVIAGIDMVDLAGDGTPHVGEQIEAGGADLLRCYAALQRRVVFVPLQNVA